MKTVSLG